MRLVLSPQPPPDAGARWDRLPPNAMPIPLPGANVDHREARVAPADPEAAFVRARDAMRRYDVYRPRRLRARVFTQDGLVAPGALIVQRIRAGPLVLEAPVRIVDFVDAPDEHGYAYATLPGHPERGVARFRLRLDRPRGEVAFTLSSWSMPGHWTTRLARRYARRVQLRETAAALERMEMILRA